MSEVTRSSIWEGVETSPGWIAGRREVVTPRALGTPQLMGAVFT